ncbi:MAG: ETC complex I subunit [Alphaproteobacteria bacterium]|nr:ETC complex I subunit [Alphaproteobacteria bacterium]
MKAKIYKPTKNAMQSGRAQGTQWVLEYDIETPRRPEPIMGWTSAEDTLNQVKMRFASREAAIAFAETHGFEFTVDAPRQRRVAPRSYLDNFKFRPYEEEAN